MDELTRSGMVSPPPDSPKLWIVLPVHNRIATTQRFVRCLKEQDFGGYTLLLVDDGCTDGTRQWVEGELDRLVVLQGDGNLWWAGALQRGFRHLKTHAGKDDVALLINDDVTFDRDFLGTGLRVLERHPRSLVLAECYSRQDGSFLDRGRLVDWRSGLREGRMFPPVPEGRQAEVFSTRGLFLRVADWRRVGGFHPWLLPHYFSDYEFTIRARRRGFALVTDPSLRLSLDQTTSGLRGPVHGFWNFVYNNLFNKRYVTSARYLMVFLLLSCERRYLPKNLIWFGQRVVRQLWRAARGAG